MPPLGGALCIWICAGMPRHIVWNTKADDNLYCLLLINCLLLLGVISSWYFSFIIFICDVHFFMSDTWGASIFRKLPAHFGIINTVCEPKVRNSRKGPAVVIVFLFWFFTTIFFSSRWFFESLAYPRSHRLVVANGVAMAVAFFLVRIAVMPPYWAKVFGTFGTPAFERLGLGAQVAWIVSCVCLDVLNVAWMYKIARGCYRVITGTSGKKKGGKACSDEPNHVNNHMD